MLVFEVPRVSDEIWDFRPTQAFRIVKARLIGVHTIFSEAVFSLSINLILTLRLNLLRPTYGFYFDLLEWSERERPYSGRS